MKPSYEELEVMLQDALDKIKASQEQEPVGYLVYNVRVPDFHYKRPKHEGMVREVFDQPPIPPELAELQRENAELRGRTDSLEVVALRKENAELRKLLEDGKVPDGWLSSELMPKDDSMDSYIIANDRGQVAPVVRGIVANNVGTKWDWDFGSKVIAYMPMPQPPKEPKQ